MKNKATIVTVANIVFWCIVLFLLALSVGDYIVTYQNESDMRVNEINIVNFHIAVMEVESNTYGGFVGWFDFRMPIVAMPGDTLYVAEPFKSDPIHPSEMGVERIGDSTTASAPRDEDFTIKRGGK